jgi:NAD(P)-dependent dehydrogenase (short-subunit alcohol dehydrogenase family)
MRATALSLNACPYLDTAVLHRRPRLCFYEGDNYCDAGGGHEGQFSTNHLGHFGLVTQLWPALVRARGARVVSVSSRGHRICGVDFDDPDFERRPYDKWKAYGQSKTANVLFAVELDRRGTGAGVRAFAVHPGSIVTDLARDLDEGDLQRFGVHRETAHGHVPAGKSVAEGGDFKTLSQGAATAVWCAVSPELKGLGGVNCENVELALAAAVEDPAPTGVRPRTAVGDRSRICGSTVGAERALHRELDRGLIARKVHGAKPWAANFVRC